MPDRAGSVLRGEDTFWSAEGGIAVAHTRVCCPCCKARLRMPTAPRGRAVRCPRCRAGFALPSGGGKATARPGTASTGAELQQAPAQLRRPPTPVIHDGLYIIMYVDLIVG